MWKVKQKYYFFTNFTSFSFGYLFYYAKITLVSPYDKGTFEKSEISNFRSVGFLESFSNIYEKVAKRFLDADMSKFLSPFLSAYNYSTQHVLIRLVVEWRERLDNNYVVGSVFMDLSKAFDCIPYDLLIAKLDAYGFKRNLVRYIYSYLEERNQCVCVNSATGSLNISFQVF